MIKACHEGENMRKDKYKMLVTTLFIIMVLLFSFGYYINNDGFNTLITSIFTLLIIILSVAILVLTKRYVVINQIKTIDPLFSLDKKIARNSLIALVVGSVLAAELVVLIMFRQSLFVRMFNIIFF